MIYELIEEGSGRTFNSGMSNGGCKWAGRWGDFYLSQQYPYTWRIRKLIRKYAN